jgi:hypothetical protein
MSSSVDTEIIDSKRKEKNNDSNTFADAFKNIRNFVITSIVFIIIVFVHFGMGGLVLYGCKLAQSNILPTQMDCAPYTDTIPKIQPIESNIFETTFGNPNVSQKIKFPYDEKNKSNDFIETLNGFKNDPQASAISNYFISILESILCFNYSYLNFGLNKINEILPEFVVVLFGPLIMFFYTLFLFLIDNIYIIYLWFSNMGWLFSKNTNEDENKPPKWESLSFLEPINYWIGFVLVFVFSVLLFLSYFTMSMPFIIGLLLVLTLCSMITYISVFNNKPTHAGKIMLEVFKNYKTTMTIIISMFIVLGVFANMGAVQGIISIVVLALIYFGILRINLFKPEQQDFKTTLTSYKQAKKSCTRPKKYLDDSWFIFGGGEKKLVRDIKNISK